MSEQLKNQMTTSGNVPAMQTRSGGEAEEVTIDVMELVFHLFAHWRFIASMALIFAILTGVYTVFFITPKYQARSTIYVLSRKDSAINMSDLQIGSALTQDYIKVFDMWEVHEEVISNLNLPYTYKEMRNNLAISNTSNTRMLDISFTSTSAEEAANVANEYANVASQYIADTMATDKPNIMSVALTPTSPVSPNKVRNVVLGFVLGAFMAMAIVTLRFVMDDNFKTSDDIRKYTGLTTLAVIPLEDTEENKKIKEGSKKESHKKQKGRKES